MTESTTPFPFPTYTTYPPFYTLQPNHTTLSHQLTLWSTLITTYHAHHHLHKLALSTPPADLFTNPTRSRALKQPDIRKVLDFMAQPQNGGRIEWVGGDTCYVWWRTVDEWADAVYGSVEETGQRGSVLTLYELREGDGGREWRGMDEGMLRKVLGVLVKRGKAQVFGQAEGEGVKFF